MPARKVSTRSKEAMRRVLEAGREAGLLLRLSGVTYHPVWRGELE